MHEETAESADPNINPTGEAPDYFESLQRLKAEYDNYRRRTEAERSKRDEQVVANFAEKLLPVLEAFEVGMEYDKNSLKPIYDLFLSALMSDGLEVIQPEAGEAFDPNLHEAVESRTIENEIAEPASQNNHVEILEVVRSGYFWRGRLLKTAQVKVS